TNGDLIPSSGSFFEFFLPKGVNITDVDDVIVQVLAGASDGAREVTNFPREIVPGIDGGNKLRIMVDLPVDAQIQFTIPVVVEQSANPGQQVVAWATMLRPHDVTDVDATNPNTGAPENPFVESVGKQGSPGYPVNFNPLTYIEGQAIPSNNIKPYFGPSILRTPELTLTKSSELTSDANGNDFADQGDVITYTFTISNTGNVVINDITKVVDAKLGGDLTI